MKKKTTVWHLLLSLTVITALSCSSNDKKDDGASNDIAEAAADGGDPAAAGDQQAGADGKSGDQGMAANDAPPADGAAPADGSTPETSPSDVAKNDQPPADGSAPPATDAPPADGSAPADGAALPADASADAPPPPADGSAPSTDTAKNDQAPPADGANQGDLFGAGAAATDAGGEAVAPAPKKSGGGKLAHIKDVPFSKGKQNLNTVYLAREGDTLESISQKLFSEDKSKMLAKGNPTLKKGVKTGDKVYFNSPNRPDDKDRMITVYEDQGLPPTTYTTKDGDTLKSLAQEWYGSEASYKEIYAINKSLTSTKELPAGTELQYWPASVNVAAYGAKKEEEVAAAPPPPPSPASNGAAMPLPLGGPGGMGQPPGQMPPPPNAMGMAGGPPPPGGPDMGMAPPPPPPPMAMKKKREPPAGNMDKDTIMYAAAAGVLLIGSGILIAVRRRNSRRNQGITQV